MEPENAKNMNAAAVSRVFFLDSTGATNPAQASLFVLISRQNLSAFKMYFVVQEEELPAWECQPKKKQQAE